jgi:hypothetical protein
VIGQGRVSPVRLAFPDLRGAEVVGQVAGADDLDAVGEDQQAN